MTVQCSVHVDRAEAIRAGRDTWGETVVEIDPAALTPEEREELATCGERDGALVVCSAPTGVGDWRPGERPVLADADDPVEAVRAWLRARMRARERDAREREEATRKALEAAGDPEKWIYQRWGNLPVVADLRDDPAWRELERVNDALPQFVRVSPPCRTYGPHVWHAVGKPFLGRADESALEPVRREAERIAAERNEAERRKALEAAEAGRARLREAVALARERRSFLEAFVREHGDERQRELYARGLLPEAELAALLDAVLFCDLDDLPEPWATCPACSRRLDWDDAGELDAVRTVEGFERLRQAEAAAERHGGKVRLRCWTADCGGCGAEYAAAVAVVARTAGPLPERERAVLLEMPGDVAHRGVDG